MAAVITVYGVIKAIVNYLANCRLKQGKIESYEKDIVRLKEENTLICFGLCAALDGLEQLGANHTVPIAKNKLDKYLNQQAHK